MSGDIKSFNKDGTWLLFWLNDGLIRIEDDGDYNVLAIMDVATGAIIGMELVSVAQEGISRTQLKKLIKSGEEKVGSVAKRFFLSSSWEDTGVIATLKSMGISIIKATENNIAFISQDARERFAERFSGH